MTPQQIRSITIGAPPLTALQSALLAAGVRPLYTDDVREYMAQKLAEERAKLLRGSHRHPWRALGAIPPLAVFVWLLWVWAHGPSGSAWTDLGCYFGLLVSSLLAIGILLSAFQREGASVRLAARLAARLLWRSYEVAECRDKKWVAFTREVEAAGVDTVTEIPDELGIAMKAIRRTGVEATFRVEQLDADPFLFVRSGVEEYCIGVWDERGFIQ